MAVNLSVEAPDYDRIRKGDAKATENAIRLLWLVANEESRSRRQNDRSIQDRLSPKVLTLAPSANQNNVDTQGAGIIHYNGTDSVNITGYRARHEGDVLVIHVTGTGTITHMDQDTDSDAGNRLVNNGAGDVAVGTNQSIILIYLNSRWREYSAA